MLKVYADSDNANEDAMMIVEGMNGHEDDRTVEVVACKGGWAIMVGGVCEQEPVAKVLEPIDFVAMADEMRAAGSDEASIVRTIKICRKIEARAIAKGL